MPTVSLSTTKPHTARADALIIGIRNDEDREAFASALELLGFTGEKGQVVAFPSNDAPCSLASISRLRGFSPRGLIVGRVSTVCPSRPAS